MLYKLSDVRIVCESWYGRKVSKRTWIYWKQLAKVPEYSREVSEQKASHLFAVAILRKRSPNQKISFVDVFKTAVNELHLIKTELDNPQPKLKPDSCRGIDLVDYLQSVTGRSVSERTLYRWGTDYGLPYTRNKIYDPEQINQWEILARTVAV